MKPSTSTFCLVLANALLPVSILLFAKGFFPYKPFLPGLAVFPDDAAEIPAPFDKVVFMMVDALRSDFVFSSRSSFHFTQSLIRDGSAVPFTAHATSPTITMPRVKAITTGSIPGFLDVILNFAESDTSSTLATQDNWLAQIRAKEGKLVMYGDDTWIKLFPGMFEREDGTTSFFVSDFTEVDNNVTRHIDSELEQGDWNGMILHYLGLDHIGHKSGPQSQFMPPKQIEMDGIVKRIYSAIESSPHLESTLFVMGGDHGMNDAGNHGGSGEGETSPALVFMSPKLRQLQSTTSSACPTTPRDGEFGFYETVEQSDIAPTLAGLLGFPVPKNNLGVFIRGFLGLWNGKERVELMMRNARQLQGLVEAANPGHKAISLADCSDASSDSDELFCLWGHVAERYELWKSQPNEAQATLDAIFKFSHRCQELLSMAASNYDLNAMLAGNIGITISALISAMHLVPLLNTTARFTTGWAYPLMAAAYAIMMFASSYVEEEHNFWYWVASGWFALLFIKGRALNRPGLYLVLVLGLLRVARRWNQTGQKYAGASGIFTGFLSDRPVILWYLIMATYFETFLTMAQRCYSRLGIEARFILSFTTAAAALSFKLSFAAHEAPELIPTWLQSAAEFLDDVPLVSQARAVFGMLAASVLYTLFYEVDSTVSKDPRNSGSIFHELTSIFLLTQSRFENAPLILIFRTISYALASIEHLSASEISFSILILQHFSFYALGNANAISSVDLSNAYNGVSGYNVIVVGILTFLSNWAGPVFWASVAPILLAQTGDGEAWRRHLWMMTSFQSLAAAGVMAACFALRTHLFIWSVFSPKFLYSTAWAVAFQLAVNVGWGEVMWWASRRGVKM